MKFHNPSLIDAFNIKPTGAIKHNQTKTRELHVIENDKVPFFRTLAIVRVSSLVVNLN